MHKKKGSAIGYGIIVAVLALVVLGATGNLAWIGAGTISGGTGSCTDDLDVSLTSRARNDLSSSSDYSYETVYLADSTGKSLTSTALTGSTFKEVSSTGTCGRSYQYFILGRDGYNAPAKSEVFTASSNKVETHFIAKNQSGINFTVYYSNMTSTMTNAHAETEQFHWGNTTCAQSFSSGTSKTYIMHIEANRSSATWGVDNLNSYILVDVPLTKISKDSGISISGAGAEVTMPTWGASQGYDKAYAIDPISSASGIRVLNIKITADLGDPGAGEDVTLLFVTEGYYEANDGTIKSGLANDALTQLNMPSSRFVFDMA